MQRRGFLAGVLAAGVAPAYVRADSLMKIFVPRQEIFVTPPGILTMRLVDAATNTWNATWEPDRPIIQLGDSGGYETSGYAGSVLR